MQQPTAQRSIERILQMNDIDWATVYLLPQKTTIESRMRIFQYKILDNILYLSNRVYKGPVRLIKQVKIAHSFLQSVSNQFHVIILSLPM